MYFLAVQAAKNFSPLGLPQRGGRPEGYVVLIKNQGEWEGTGFLGGERRLVGEYNPARRGGEMKKSAGNGYVLKKEKSEEGVVGGFGSIAVQEVKIREVQLPEKFSRRGG